MNPHTPHPDEDRSSADLPPTDRPGTELPAEGQADAAPAGSAQADSAQADGQPPRLYQPGDPDGPYSAPPNDGAAPPRGVPGQGVPGPDGQLPARQPAEFLRLGPEPGNLPRTDRWVGGVASGIAQRLGVDPLIVRGIFIVLAIFAGVGVLLYGLAWALLPEPDGRIHVQEAAAGRWSGGMTGALITTLIGLPGLGSGVWGWDRHGFGGFIWTVFWLGGIGYLVYYLIRRNKTLNGPPCPRTPIRRPDEFRRARRTARPGSCRRHGRFRRTLLREHLPTGASYGSTPYAGTHTAAPDPARPGPTPARRPHAPPRKRLRAWRPRSGSSAKPRNLGPGAPAVAVTAGLALLVGGGIKALDAANVIDLGDSSNAVVWASGAAVLGLGILSPASGDAPRDSGSSRWWP